MHFGKRSSRLRPHDAAYSTADAPMGPKAPKSTVLTTAEEATVVAFQQKTLLPLDDVLGCLRDTIPNLSRSACIATSNVMASPDCRSRIV
jgi:hypothetical protein